MAKFKDPNTKEIIEIGNPEMNPELAAGKTPVSDETSLGTITSDMVQPQAPLNIPPTQQPVDLSPTADAGLESLLASFNAPTQAGQTSTDLQEMILGSMDVLGTETTRKTQLEEEKGLGEQRTELQGVVNQLQALAKQRAAIPIKLIQESEGRGRTTGAMDVLTRERNRENTIESLGLSAIGQTLQGNIALAESSIQNALKAEFEPERLKLQTFQQLYLFNKDALEREDKQKSDNLNILLSERSRLLNKAETEKSFTSNLMLEAVRSGMSTSDAEKMRNMTPEDAIAFGAKAFGADFQQKAEQQAFDNGIRTRQLRMQEAQYNLDLRKDLLNRAEVGDQTAIDELGYDPNDLPITYDEALVLEGQKITIESDIEDIQNAIDNKDGLKASSGLVKGGWAIAGAFLKGGIFFGAANVAKKRNSFMSTARYVVNNLTLNMVGELTERGIKLNPISEEEIKLMGQASKRLVSGGEFKDGELTGFNLSAEEVEAELKEVLLHYEKLKNSIIVDMTMTEAEKKEALK